MLKIVDFSYAYSYLVYSVTDWNASPPHVCPLRCTLQEFIRVVPLLSIKNENLTFYFLIVDTMRTLD